MSQSQCESCSTVYTVRPEDLDLLARISPNFGEKIFLIPPPRRCPSCREQLRMAWRNETKLFTRTCSATGQRLISIYPPSAPFPVYRHKEWFNDKYDACQFGADYDPTRSLFAQMAELQRLAPRFHVFNFQEELDENSQYTNCAGCNKNCYLIFASGYNEQCLYGRYSNKCFDCVDSFFLDQCRSCYDSSDLTNCERVFFSRQCKDCNESYFLYDCKGCAHCIGCVGLRRQEYCIFNQKLTKDEYVRQKGLLELHTREGQNRVRNQFEQFAMQFPRRATHGELNENSIGDYVWNTKNCYFCFDCRNAEDSAYCTFFIDGRDSLDIYSWGELELCYQISGGGSYGEYRSAFTAQSFGCKECFYLDHCVFCEHCFGCVGLKHKKYCILNRQYSKSEYERLVPTIIARMTEMGEWGEFLPAAHSPFGYNHSVAVDYYPLSRDEAQRAGWAWSDYQAPTAESSGSKASEVLPSQGVELSDEHSKITLVCETSSKSYRLTKAEIEFYRRHDLPAPLLHPDEREKNRMARRNPRRIWARECSSCATSIQTSYSPNGKEIVLCEDCYNKNMT